MADVFLSYSREDQSTARKFADALQRQGFSVWWDQALRSGETYDRVTEKALEEARAVVVLWSRASVESKWVRSEATEADRRNTLVPVMIEPCKRPIMFELNQSADLSGWQGDLSDARWVAFVDDVRAVTGTAQPGTGAPAAVVPAGVAKGSRRSAWVAIAALALAALGAGTWILSRGDSGDFPPGEAASAGKPAGDVTLAVLPFVNRSSDPEQEYFVDGLTEELLNSLAEVAGLQVTGRTSSFYFKGKNEDMKIIGEKLGVDNLLEGSVRRSGENLRIDARLVKAKDGFHLWSQTYDRPLTEVFKVQEEIATSVADALQISLGIGDLGRTPGMTHDIHAYQAYVEAGAMSGQTSAQTIGRQIERLNYAVERDPSFIWAWMRLSGIYRFQSNLGDPNSGRSQEMLRKAEEAQAQAVRVSPDPRLAELITDGIRFQRGEWIKAERRWLYEQPIIEELKLKSQQVSESRNPLYRIAEDKAREAIEEFEGRRARDPMNQRVAMNLSEAYANAGRIREAMEEQRRGISIAADPLLEVSALFTAKASGDAALLENSWQVLISNPATGADYRKIHELRDRPREALAELQRLGLVNPLWAAFFGDDALALELLRTQNNPDRRFATAMMLWRPIMSGVRKNPAFKEVVRETGLLEYWREFGWGEHCRPVGEADFECQ
jgi:TolB-like protein